MPKSVSANLDKPWTLKESDEAGDLVRIECSLCSVRRVYRPSDLRRLEGDVRLEYLRKRMRCEKCGHNDYIRASVFRPTAQELQKIRIRRLVGIRMVRKVIWQDEPPN